jgi:hypothetical protein
MSGYEGAFSSFRRSIVERKASEAPLEQSVPIYWAIREIIRQSAQQGVSD